MNNFQMKTVRQLEDTDFTASLMAAVPGYVGDFREQRIFIHIIYSLSFQFWGCNHRWSHGFYPTAHKSTCERHVTDLDRALPAKSKNYIQICS